MSLRRLLCRIPRSTVGFYSTESRAPPLVSAEWLSEKLKQKSDDVALLHISWRGMDEHCAQYVNGGHIDGALCFDGAKCISTTSPYKNMLPTPEQFAEFVSSMGIRNDQHIVVYDADAEYPNMDPACRAWWMWRVMGHSRVSILDGGLVRWLVDGHKIVKGQPHEQPIVPGKFTTEFNKKYVASFEQVVEMAKADDEKYGVLLDARYPVMFGPQVPEDMEKMKANIGHVRNARNLPFVEVMQLSNRQILPKDKLLELFDDVGVADPVNTPITTMCHTGMRACAVALAAHVVGNEQNVRVYDGSWFEFQQRADANLKITQD